MPSKYQKISDLAAQTSVAATSSTRRYLDFLRTAANNYKYAYEEQILIHAQKPEATACAEMAVWNRLGRWVNRGVRGIALLSETTLPYKLRYVFDVSDTNSYYNREISLWRMRPTLEPAVTEALFNAFGETPDVTSFTDTVMELSATLTEDNLSDYAAMLRDAKTDSLLEDLDDDNLNYRLRFLVQNSVAFMVFTRCGLDPSDYLESDLFSWVIDFNTPDTAAVLGNASSDISEMLLREVERAVRAVEREQKDSIRTFASPSPRLYDAAERTNAERSEAHEPDLSPGGRVPDARPDPAGEPDDWALWNAAARVPAAAPTPDLQRDADERKAELASGGDRPDGGPDAGAADGSDGAGRGRNGDAESTESDGVGRTDEQHPEPRRGDGPERPDLRLNDPPPLEDSHHDFNARREIDYYYHDAEKQELIRSSSALKNHRTEIATFFDTHPDAEERGDFVKSFYDGAPVEMMLSNDQLAGYRAYDDVLYLWRGEYQNREREVHMRWSSVAQTIYGMMLLQEWLSPEEQPLPNTDEQISLIQEEAVPATEFVLPQEAVDYVLCGGSGLSQGKLRIYAQFQKGESSAENIQFLKSEYGTGGHSDAIPGTGYWEDHDSKGIRITERYRSDGESESRSVLLSWPKVEKRIRELIALDRYLTEAEKTAIEQEVEPVVEVPAEEEPPEQPLPAPPVSTPRVRITPTQLYPDVPTEQRHDHRITSDNLGVGTPSERYYHNVMAIQLLKKLESEGRLADRLEQDILGDYVGWGGLADYFDERNSHYQELKDLLTEEEYAAARESTLTAFYTPPVVIRSIYDALQNMGFQRGNILEPSCGIGNFIGMKPETLSDSRVYGVELDSISGRIAQQLYQNASIAVQGFEKTELPDSFFDVAIGNVPFGNFKIMDKRYDKYNFLIHDYFFARTLDKVRPGGVIAFITSKGTLDKENPNVRKYLAQRADLIGAIRLPNDTFKAVAGTDVTSDIIFLQKRDTMSIEEPSWVHLGTDENGLKMNQYFIDNPDMILGRMQEISGPYGPETACLPYEDQDPGELLSAAVQNIHAQIAEYDLNELEEDSDDRAIPADPSVRNFSYTIVDGEVYYRENSVMVQVELSVTAANRIKGMIGIRDSVRQLIEYQTEDYPDSTIQSEQQKLNKLYDSFVKKYGIINSRANKSVFRSDNSFCLLTSLEVLDDEGNFLRKADMFSKRTIRQRIPVTHVDTASEALPISLAERAKVDMPFMEELTGKTEQEIYADLKGVIFLNPMHGYGGNTEEKYLPADEYLSGNVREKLVWARHSAELYPEDYSVNVEALERVQPADLGPGEISVRLGATWLPPSDIEEFMFHLLRTPRYMTWNIHVHYSPLTAEWNIDGKSNDRGNVNASSTYGTDRINAYKLIEQTLNLREVKIFDYIEEADGKRKPVLNKKETALAQAKQEAIKQAFQDWIWTDPERRDRLVKLYNERFNSTRPREYDGSHLVFPGMNPEIVLRAHQLNAIARGLYGKNVLLGHVVGAGKTWTAVAIAQESKRLGLCHKTLIVVPNHLTEQWGAEYLQLYPAANIFVATAKDFEKQNRKKFCARIATGDYDAVIIGHSQLEKLPLSLERQTYMLQQQIDEIMEGIAEAKANRAERFTVKQMERAKKSVEAKLAKLNDQSRKDDLITFEELGVDKLIIDEAHSFKNLAAFTKMQNVGGISQTEAQKSSDLFMKCRYMDEITGGKGIVFATGTPISNTMVELYTMQRYLQYSTLEAKGLSHFDAWASTFGETVTAIELAPEGTGYRAKTRFARFYNLPELMAMFKEVADIQTADMLNLPVPKAIFHTEALKPSEFQKQMVDDLAKRAERVRAGMVNSSEDNMLVITNDGRKLALDQRLINPMLPSSETGKVAACAQNVFDIWQRTAEQRSTQMVFIDLSTPRADAFNVYDAIRSELIEKGIPEEEIAFIHGAKTEAQKKELFGKVRSGQIRVLLGSTAKMGAGTNAQNKLIALHHTDCPWRPADLQQREGRIIRQGNENPEVEIFTYVTENTFDSYLYQLVESKQRFIGQIMTSKSPVRSAEDVDETALSYAEIKALCSGNPKIKEKMDLDVAVQRLKLLKASYLNQKYALEDRALKEFPAKIKALEQRIEGYTTDAAHLEANTHPNEDSFCPMMIEGTTYTDKKAAGSAILAACQNMTSPDAIPLGTYRGFAIELYFESFSKEYRITLKHDLTHTVSLGDSITGNIQRIDNVLSDFANQRHRCEEQLENTKLQLETAKTEAAKPFPQEEELRTKSARLDELNIELNMDRAESEILDSGPETEDAEISEVERCAAR